MTTTTACAGLEALFFPEGSGQHIAHAYREAKAICADCPIKADCLAGALERRELFGVWGATTPEERHQLLNPRRNAYVAPRKHTPHETEVMRLQRYDAGLTDREMAEAEGASRYVIGNWRARRGLPVNPDPNDPRRHRR